MMPAALWCLKMSTDKQQLGDCEVLDHTFPVQTFSYVSVVNRTFLKVKVQNVFN